MLSVALVPDLHHIGPEHALRTARRLAEAIAVCLQGSLLVRHAPAAVADAFCASRLGGDWGNAYGTLPPSADFTSIIGRVTPKVA